MADVTDADFETAVIERSKTVPVVIDLWAPWCGPCQTLGPMLEEVIGETQGLVELAKVDVDQNPGVHQAFQVQGIPAVYAMIDGKVVDGFMGGQPMEIIVEFVQKLIDIKAGIVPNPADGPNEDGEDPEDGTQGVADTGDDAGAAGDDSAAETASPTLSEPGDDVTPAAAPQLSAEEADKIESQLIEMLTTVKGDDEQREAYLSLLEQLGPDDPRTNTYRRKLATALF